MEPSSSRPHGLPHIHSPFGWMAIHCTKERLNLGLAEIDRMDGCPLNKGLLIGGNESANLDLLRTTRILGPPIDWVGCMFITESV